MKTQENPFAAKASDEWYTPPDLVEACSRVFEGKFYDPCLCPGTPASDAAWNSSVLFDARSSDWWAPAKGTPVMLNPAYSDPLAFVQSLLGYVESTDADAILIVNASTAARWFQEAAAASDAICFPSPRIRFMRRPEVYKPKSDKPEDVAAAEAQTQAEIDEAAASPWGLVHPSSPRYNNAIFYYGRRGWHFEDEFSRFGQVYP